MLKTIQICREAQFKEASTNTEAPGFVLQIFKAAEVKIFLIHPEHPCSKNSNVEQQIKIKNM